MRSNGAKIDECHVIVDERHRIVTRTAFHSHPRFSRHNRRPKKEKPGDHVGSPGLVRKAAPAGSMPGGVAAQ